MTTDSQLYEWGWYINPASHGTFIINSNDREMALKHLLENLGTKSLPEYAVLHCWITVHPTLEAHELRAENKHLKECLELQANAVKTHIDLFHEANTKLAMMADYFENIEGNPFSSASSKAWAREALDATAEDVERWKAEQRLKWATEEYQRVLLQEERLKESLPIATGSVLKLAAAGYRYYEALQQDRFTLIDEVDEAEKSFLKSADSLSPEVKAMLNSINTKQDGPNA